MGITAGVGMAASAYFGLEASAAMPGLFDGSPFLAKLFTEDPHAHFATVSDLLVAPLVFGVAFVTATRVVDCRHPGRLTRRVYALSALAFPWTTVIITMLQALVFGRFCFACLVETLVSLALVDFSATAIQSLTARGTTRPTSSQPVRRDESIESPRVRIPMG